MCEFLCIIRKESAEEVSENYIIPEHSQIPSCTDHFVIVRPRSMFIRMNTCYICGKTYGSNMCPIESLNIFIGQSVAYLPYCSDNPCCVFCAQLSKAEYIANYKILVANPEIAKYKFKVQRTNLEIEDNWQIQYAIITERFGLSFGMLSGGISKCVQVSDLIKLNGHYLKSNVDDIIALLINKNEYHVKKLVDEFLVEFRKLKNGLSAKIDP